MGMVDEVAVPCPRCCQVAVMQSKGAPDPCLAKYTLLDAPAGVLAYLDGDAEVCGRCGQKFEVKVKAVAFVVPVE